ncbi:hypothetical protein L6452_39208 [Arctium lappa]|uniref:Uncharacterized protein n=1 Tax=Arctium lappa TaxID=4217 RepID=A0ACB8XSE5_ARCLA|nr:hypothetical protein L6452_39208 [Arctium lappa]
MGSTSVPVVEGDDQRVVIYGKTLEYDEEVCHIHLICWKEYLSVILRSEEVKSGKPSPNLSSIWSFSHIDDWGLLSLGLG